MNPNNTKEQIKASGKEWFSYIGSWRSTMGREHQVTVDDRHRLMHVLNIGPTGSGKTQLMVHMALQDAEKGHGFCMVIPKGDAIQQVIAKLPEDRLDDLVYFNPATRTVTPVNVLEPHGTAAMNRVQEETQKEIIVADLIDLFKRHEDGEWGPRWGTNLETLLRAHIDLNIHRGERNTLVDVFRCVVNEDDLTALIDRTVDPVDREQLIHMKEDLSSREMEPLERRIQRFMRPTIRNVIGVEESGVDFREAVNTGKIILVDIQKGEVGDTVAEVIGSIIITKIWAAAQSRITMPEDERPPFFLYVDELQNFGGEGSNFKKILAEAREYKLGCWLATQYLHHLARDMRHAVANNCRTRIIGECSGDDDLPRLERMVKGLDRKTLIHLADYQFAVQTPGDGARPDAMICRTYPPWRGDRDDEEVGTIMDTKSLGDDSGVVKTLTGTVNVGPGQNAGKEAHDRLLAATEGYFEAEGYSVSLLYQTAGADKPDGILRKDGRSFHLEAEASTLSKPAKVLKNYKRAVNKERETVFVVDAGNAMKLANIFDDPVNRRGSEFEDDRGTYSYYEADSEPFTAIDDLDGGYRIFEVRGETLVEFDRDTDAECPELVEGNGDEAALENFCVYRSPDGYCSAIEAPCVLEWQEGE